MVTQTVGGHRDVYALLGLDHLPALDDSTWSRLGDWETLYYRTGPGYR